MYVIADNPIGESWFYPDSGKWGVQSPKRRLMRSDDLEYFDGENEGARKERRPRAPALSKTERPKQVLKRRKQAERAIPRHEHRIEAVPLRETRLGHLGH